MSKWMNFRRNPKRPLTRPGKKVVNFPKIHSQNFHLYLQWFFWIWNDPPPPFQSFSENSSILAGTGLPYSASPCGSLQVLAELSCSSFNFNLTKSGHHTSNILAVVCSVVQVVVVALVIRTVWAVLWYLIGLVFWRMIHRLLIFVVVLEVVVGVQMVPMKWG